VIDADRPGPERMMRLFTRLESGTGASGMTLMGSPRTLPQDRVLTGDSDQSKDAVLSRSALAITLTEDKAMAAAAITGESRIPNSG
jgi:hypothetical protein